MVALEQPNPCRLIFDLANIDTNSSDYGDVLAAIRAAADADPDVTFDGISTLTYMATSDGASMTDLSITLPMTNDALIEGPEDFFDEPDQCVLRNGFADGHR